MSKFTKGKCFLSRCTTKAGKRNRISVDAGVSLSDGVIKTIATISGTNTESEANARRIVAAPEMYDFLLIAAEDRFVDRAAMMIRARKLLDRIDAKENGHD